ncbi:hypothetical protein C9374_006694 [Naegleria lovaniensis]|uniref:VASt domain-containing protein n=1 Tax=Naegleria lovaniensis TaxID=51637 RepID=A0AA88GLF9_NAELO|nr:uncharacterized protein C9374_006694 [Naegleria lovaniensis]KAG2379577.1 hypothetical protein C9374_006694 [Naegleria lovaniensis]
MPDPLSNFSSFSQAVSSNNIEASKIDNTELLSNKQTTPITSDIVLTNIAGSKHNEEPPVEEERRKNKLRLFRRKKKQQTESESIPSSSSSSSVSSSPYLKVRLKQTTSSSRGADHQQRRYSVANTLSTCEVSKDQDSAMRRHSATSRSPLLFHQHESTSENATSNDLTNPSHHSLNIPSNRDQFQMGHSCTNEDRSATIIMDEQQTNHQKETTRNPKSETLTSPEQVAPATTSSPFVGESKNKNYIASSSVKTTKQTTPLTTTTAVATAASKSSSFLSPSKKSVVSPSHTTTPSNTPPIKTKHQQGQTSSAAMAMDKFLSPSDSSGGGSPALSSPIAIKNASNRAIEEFLSSKSPPNNDSVPSSIDKSVNDNIINSHAEESEESGEEDVEEDEEDEYDEEESDTEETEEEESEENNSSTREEALASTISQPTRTALDIEDLMGVKTMISPKDLQTISYEVNEKLNESVQKEFNLGPDEQVLDSFLCAYYESKMPQQGKMYITQNFVCFSSNIFGYKINLVIAFSDIKRIEKRMTAMIIPNAIEIFLKDNTSHFFGSFVFRDNVYKVLLALCSLHAKARGNILLNLQNSSSLPQPMEPKTSEQLLSTEDDGDDEEHEDELNSDQGYDEDEGDESDDEQSDDTQSVELDEVRHSQPAVESLPKNNDTNQQPASVGTPTKNGKSGESGEPNNNGSKENSNSGGDDKKNEKSEKNERNDKNDKNDKQDNNNTNNQEEENEDEDDEFDGLFPEEDDKITGIQDLPAGDFFADPDKIKPKDIITDVLPVSITDAWYILKSDNINFQNEHHKTREETNVQYTPYVKVDNNPGIMRKLFFVAKINNSIGPKSSRMECVERAILCKGKKKIINQISTFGLDIPFSDTFRVNNYWILEDIDGKSCSVKIMSGVYFLKSSLLRWKIEEAADKESKTALTLWMSQAKETITNAKASGNLPSIKKSTKPKKKKTPSKEATKRRSKRKSTKPISETESTLPTATPTKAVDFSSAPQQAANPFSSPSPFLSSPSTTDAGQDLLTKVMNFVFNIPTYLSSNISLPAWVFLTIILILIFLIFSQQYSIIQTVKHLEHNVQIYKQQAVLFEQELNHLVFNISELNTSKIVESSRQIQSQLAEWLAAKNELYKSHIDNELLHSLLYELAELKNLIKKKDPG